MSRIGKKLKIYRQRLVWIRHASDRGGVSMLKAWREMKKARNEYGISYEKYAKENVAGIKDEDEKKKKIEAILKQQRIYIRRAAEAAGWTEEEAKKEMDRIRKRFGISYYDYSFHQLYEMSDDEISEWKKSRNEKRREIIEYAVKESGWSRNKVIKHMAHCSADYAILQASYKINRCWEISDEQLSKMANDGDSAALSTKYNRNASKLVDKELFDSIYEEFISRKHWTNEEGNSFKSFCDFADGIKEAFYKPRKLSCGMGAGAISIPDDEEGRREIYDWFMDKDPLVVEEKIHQHPAMSEMHPASVNTIRIANLQTEDGEVHQLYSFVRFGTKPGVDNFKNGGIAAAVDLETGVLITDAKDNEGNTYIKHPISGLTIKGFKLPLWEETLDLVKRALMHDDDVNYAGWDVAITDEKPVLVEGNSRSQSSIYQNLFDAKTEGKRYLYERFL